jgi:hypothetical protein
MEVCMERRDCATETIHEAFRALPVSNNSLAAHTLEA